ncbi:MAG: DUF1761 domain-containing protein [Bacteroidetes bacterium]|nr:DUF1761 domain-containing protein [Bacteroidota bacterium]
MIIQHLNWLAVAAGAIAYFVLGAIWFGPIFGKMWMAGHKINPPSPEEKEKMKKEMWKFMLPTLVLCFVGTVALAYFIHVFSFYNVNWRWYSGVKVALVGGVGFTSVAIIMNYIYLQKPLKIMIIDSAFHVAGLTIASIILSVWM